MRFFRPVPRLSLAQPADAAALAELYSKAFTGVSGLDARLLDAARPPEAEVRSWFHGGFEVYRASIDDRLLGSVRCCFPISVCYVDRLAVDPAERGKGFGRYLLEHAVSRARKAGAGKVWHVVSPRLETAVSICGELGFRTLARHHAGYWGEDVLLLELPL